VFDHVTIRVASRAAAERFYVEALRCLDVEVSHRDDAFVEWSDFSLTEASEERPVTEGLHVGFVAPSRAHVDAFWKAGVGAGFEDAGPPGERPHYKPDYYGAFLRDPDGNSIEAVHHAMLRTEGVIDHLWLRAGALEVTHAFYELVADIAGFEVRHHADGHLQIVGASGSFSVVPGPPTRGLHMAFPAAADAAVADFHRRLTAAGYRDDGAPGERPEYHAGYYAAFVLDPAGNSVELVNHNRPTISP
jgi:catechol 2,3-dioxygenase-like lactoylglutathione lyase family enzyme